MGFLISVVTVFLVGMTLCLHKCDRNILLHIRDTMSECDMQQNYRFNDILLLGQNWVTDEPAIARGQCVRKRGRQGGALLRLHRRNLRPPRYHLCFFPCLFMCNLQSKRDYKECSVFLFTETWFDATIPHSAVQPPPPRATHIQK